MTCVLLILSERRTTSKSSVDSTVPQVYFISIFHFSCENYLFFSLYVMYRNDSAIVNIKWHQTLNSVKPKLISADCHIVNIWDPDTVRLFLGRCCMIGVNFANILV